MTLGSTQPLTRKLSGGKGRLARKADLTTMCKSAVIGIELLLITHC
jgi:hypothetical protein